MRKSNRHYRAVFAAALLVLASPVTVFGGEILGSDAYSTAIGTIDRDTAAWGHIGSAGVPITGMTYDTNRGILYGISPSYDALFTINTRTGESTPVANPGVLGYDNANGLAYDAVNDVLYGTDNNTNHLFTIDPTTGQGTMIAQIGNGFSEIEGLGFDPTTETLYGISQLQRRIVSIDTTNGNATAVSGELPDMVWRGLEWDPQYNVLYASAVVIFNDAAIYNFNPESGRLDFRGNTTGVEGIQGLAVLPEPSTILLCLAAIPMIARRRA